MLDTRRVGHSERVVKTEITGDRERFEWTRKGVSSETHKLLPMERMRNHKRGSQTCVGTRGSRKRVLHQECRQVCWWFVPGPDRHTDYDVTRVRSS